MHLSLLCNQLSCRKTKLFFTGYSSHSYWLPSHSLQWSKLKVLLYSNKSRTRQSPHVETKNHHKTLIYQIFENKTVSSCQDTNAPFKTGFSKSETGIPRGGSSFVKQFDVVCSAELTLYVALDDAFNNSPAHLEKVMLSAGTACDKLSRMSPHLLCQECTSEIIIKPTT